MMGRHHAASGAVAGLALGLLAHQPAATTLAASALAGGAAMLPDLDEPGSTVARAAEPLSGAIAYLTARIAGGHREATHSLAAAGLATGGVAALGMIAIAPHVPATIVPLGVCVALCVRAVPPRALRIGRVAALLFGAIEPGSRVITDGWSSYPSATRDHYEHHGTSIAASGLPAHAVLPATHRVFSLVKRWVMGTLQGSVAPEHLQAYFDEWVFRFNRRHSRSRGLLFHTLLSQAVGTGPITYREMRLAGRTRPAPSPPTRARSRPASLDLGDVGLPWRRLVLSSGRTTP